MANYIDAELLRAEIERRITDNTFGAKLELIDILAWLDTLESEKPINPEDAMKELDEKIALVKQRGTWDGVDVDKYMDEVRGREPEKPMNQEGLEEEAVSYCFDNGLNMSPRTATDFARHFYELGLQDKVEVCEDLEQEIQSFWNRASGFQPKFATLEVKENGFAVIARHFAQWQKEKFMKGSVEAVFLNTPYPTICLDDCEDYNFKDGDKFHIIIVKED